MGKKNGKNGNRNKYRRRYPRGSNSIRSNQLVDFTRFNARRKFRYIVPVNITSSGAPEDIRTVIVPLTRNGVAANAIPALSNLINSFTSSKVDKVLIHFDRRRGSSNYRCGAFILPGAPANYDPTQTGEIATFSGTGINQLRKKSIALRIGPEFATGRFQNPNIPVDTTDSVFIYTDGYGTDSADDADVLTSVRMEVHVTTLGPPIDFNLAGRSQESSHPRVREIIDDFESLSLETTNQEDRPVKSKQQN